MSVVCVQLCASQVAVETRAIIAWMEKHPFVLGANIQGGEKLITYPFDMQRPPKMTTRSHDGRGRGAQEAEEETSEDAWARAQWQREEGLRETPDDAMFRWLATSYASSHLTMTETYRGSCHTDDLTTGQGIINRASWRPVVGSKYEKLAKSMTRLCNLDTMNPSLH